MSLFGELCRGPLRSSECGVRRGCIALLWPGSFAPFGVRPADGWLALSSTGPAPQTARRAGSRRRPPTTRASFARQGASAARQAPQRAKHVLQVRGPAASVWMTRGLSGWMERRACSGT